MRSSHWEQLERSEYSDLMTRKFYGFVLMFLQLANRFSIIDENLLAQKDQKGKTPLNKLKKLIFEDVQVQSGFGYSLNDSRIIRNSKLGYSTHWIKPEKKAARFHLTSFNEVH